MTIYGWDMSHFDGPSVGNAINEGISFITHKAGGDKLDDELGAWWSGVRGLDPGRVLLGAYWVLYPGNPAGRADAFIARLDDVCSGWRNRPFILQADCEKWNGDPGTVPSKAEIQAFCARLQNRAPKLKPIVYAPKWVYGDSLTGLGYPLWASSYVTASGGFKSLYPGDGSSKWNPYSGQTPAILQYTSSATIGGQTTCDANAYRGTLAELTNLLAPGWTEDIVTPDEISKVADAVVAKLTELTSWTDSLGGQHTPVGDAVLRSGYPQAPGATRTPVWTNLQALQTDVTGIATSVQAIRTALAQPASVDVNALATALAPLLPQGGSSPAELRDAFIAAFEELATRPAA